MKRLLLIAAVLAALSLAAPPSSALDPAQTKRIKKAINGSALPEIPGVVANLVAQASKQDREEVAVTAVQTALYKAPSSAPMVVSAVAKAAPELSDVVLKKAIEMEPTQFATVAPDGRGHGRGGISATGANDGNRGVGGGVGGGAENNRGRGGSGNVTPNPGSGEHNPGPPLPGSGPHHNRPPHPRGGPPGLVDYSKPRPHH